MNIKNYDVVIVGSGIAGLYSAINLSSDLKILVLTKKELKLCNSALAQGGIAGVYNSPEDSPEYHKRDTLIAGGNENDEKNLDILVNEAKIDIQKIIDLGVEFDKKPDGDYDRTLEGGHSKRRIFHNADATGFEILTTLIRVAKRLPNVDIVENALVCDIKKTSTGFSFDVLKNSEHLYYNSHFTILATGGIGRVYKFTTNSAIATGDGITFAYNLGITTKNLSYIQFHPTAFNNRETRECFLISEAVRGEGAYLRNCKHERFMKDYDERLELAPRDVVSHSILMETKKTGSDEFYLDITHKSKDFLKNRFPMIYKNLKQQGYDMAKDMIPIYPCQHYLMGGIKVDEFSQTSMENVYACGECSCTGVHGNNRLASNSLLEALVFSRRCAQHINEKVDKVSKDFENYNFIHDDNAPVIPKGLRTEIRTIMQNSYFVVPDKEGIKVGYEKVKKIKEMLENEKWKLDQDYVIAKSLATIAFLILEEVK
jgi:L-aspartate oxidase